MSRYVGRRIVIGCVMAGVLAVLAGCEKARVAAPIRLEHVALNVNDPAAMADWYAENLDMVIVWKGDAPGNGRFVADAGRNVMLELYHNTDVMIPEYPLIDWHVFHVAFLVDDIEAVRARLIKAGATPDTEITTKDNGDQMMMLRDPWGVALQFFKRAQPML